MYLFRFGCYSFYTFLLPGIIHLNFLKIIFIDVSSGRINYHHLMELFLFYVACDSNFF